MEALFKTSKETKKDLSKFNSTINGFHFFIIFSDTLDVINAYMNRKNINSELQTRIREYLNFTWNEEKTQNIEEEEKIISSLSASLKEELKLESFGFFVKNNPLFIKFFSDESLKSLINVMKEIFYTPDDVIFQVSLRIFPKNSIIFSKTKEMIIQQFILLRKEVLMSTPILIKLQF